MKNQVKLTALTLCLSIGLLQKASAQQTINVAGNSAVIYGMTFDYSIGEMTVVSTAKSGNLIVTQGLLQPQTSTGNANTTNEDNQHISSMAGMINVYPNPTSNILYIETKDQQAGQFIYQLFDATGKLVASSKEMQKEGVNKY
nr:T9SS type A sorting domain-containing protein [Chitinophagaceae bacterium]